MPKGLITSLLIKLTVDYWYFTLIALVIKLFLVRFTATDSILKVILIWITGSITFFCIACLAGIVFSSTGFYYTPFIMYIFAVLAELTFMSIFFRISTKRLLPSVLIGNGLFFFLMFVQMM